MQILSEGLGEGYMTMNAEADQQSRLGNLMASIGESKAGRRLTAFSLIAAGVGGSIAATEGSAAASVEQNQERAVTDSTMLRDGTETALPLAVTPVNDMYNVYAGIRSVSFGPILNDVPNSGADAAAVEAVEICGFDTPDTGITFQIDPYNTDSLRVSVSNTVTGEHHSTITLCNPEDGSSATSDFGLNVSAVHNIVIKKLQKMKHGLHMIKATNPNDMLMSFNGSYSTTTIAPHKTKKILVPQKSKYTAFLPGQLVLAGKGKIKFPH